jgi:hypothetical protein
MWECKPGRPWEAIGSRTAVQISSRKKKKPQTLSEKQTKRKRVGGMDQVEEHLPNKCKALNSNPRTTKKKMHSCNTR